MARPSRRAPLPSQDGSGVQAVALDSWVVRGRLEAKPAFEQWSWSYYNAVMQLLSIGEGIVPPQRLAELWMYIISILLGASMYAIFVASLTSTISEIGTASRRYRARLDALSEWMAQSQMPADLREKLMTFYELHYPRHQMLDQEAIKHELSHPLRLRITLHHCHPVRMRLGTHAQPGSCACAFVCTRGRDRPYLPRSC